MRKIKKLIFAIASMLVFSSIASAEDISIWYKTDLEDYTGGSFVTTTTEVPGWATAGTLSNAKVYTDENSNKWINVPEAGKFSTFQYAVPDITSGKLFLSFDMRLSELDTTNTTFIQAIGNASVRFFTVNHNDKKISLASGGASYNMEWDTPVRVDLVIDADAKTMGMAVAGKKIGETDYSNSKTQMLQIRIYGGTMMDNFKIAYAPSGANEFIVSEIRDEDGKIVVGFSQTPADVELLKNIKLKNLYDGTMAEISDVAVKTQDSVELTCEDLIPNDAYVLEIPGGISDVWKNELAPTKAVFSKKDGSFALRDISFIDYDGREYVINDELTPLMKTLSLEFSEDLDYDSIQGCAKIICEETDEEVNVELNAEDNILNLDFAGCLHEAEAYRLVITGLKSVSGNELPKVYSIPFSTVDGEVKVLDLGFFKGDTEVLASDVLPGETVSIKFKALKPAKEEDSFYVSCGLFEGKFMRNFKFSEFKISGEETLAQGSLEVTVPEKADSSLMGYLWSEAGGFALTNKIQLSK